MENYNLIGKKIKGIREIKNLSIDDIAERSGLDAKLIEYIEKDEVFPSVPPLMKLARALGVRLGTFLDDQEEKGAVISRQSEMQHSDIVTLGNRAALSDDFMKFHALSKNKSGRHIECFVIELSKRDERCGKLELLSLEGEKFIYVLSGSIELTYGAEHHSLDCGDSIHLDSIVPHNFEATTSDAKVLTVLYSPF